MLRVCCLDSEVNGDTVVWEEDHWQYLHCNVRFSGWMMRQRKVLVEGEYLQESLHQTYIRLFGLDCSA
jgi:hypothetical protein